MGQVVDRRTDIYSCGVMLYQLLTGERPYEGSMTSIMHKATTTVPPPPSEIAVTSPVRLDPVVARAMAKRPEDRFDTAAEFAAALRAPAASTAFDIDETLVAKPKAPIPAQPVAGPRETAAAGCRWPSAAALRRPWSVAAAVAWFLLPTHDAVPPACPSRPASCPLSCNA